MTEIEITNYRFCGYCEVLRAYLVRNTDPSHVGSFCAERQAPADGPTPQRYWARSMSELAALMGSQPAGDVWDVDSGRFVGRVAELAQPEPEPEAPEYGGDVPADATPTPTPYAVAGVSYPGMTAACDAIAVAWLPGPADIAAAMGVAAGALAIEAETLRTGGAWWPDIADLTAAFERRLAA